MWNTLRGEGNTHQASDLKGTRWAVLKNSQDLTGEQRTTIATIAKTNNPPEVQPVPTAPASRAGNVRDQLVGLLSTFTE